MRYLLFFFLLVIVRKGLAQSESFNLRINAGYPFQELTTILPTDSCYYASAVVTDSTGGLLTIGSLFLKLDLTGQLLWSQQLGTPNKYYELWGEGLFPTVDSSFAALGIVRDSIRKGVFIKYNSNGDTLLTKEYKSPFYPDEPFITAQAMHPDNQGGFFLLFGVDAQPDGVNAEYFMIHVDINGEILATYNYGTPLTDIPKSLLVHADGALTLGGSQSNITSVSQNFIYRSHMLHLDESLSQLWQYTTPSNELYNHANALLPTPDGGLIVGTGKGVENFDAGWVEWHPCFFKLNADRQMEWVREFRSPLRGPIFSTVKIAAAADSSGYVGVSWTADDVSIEVLRQGTWVMKTSPQGDSLWVRYFTLFDEELLAPEPMDLKATPDGGYIVCGAIDPPDDGGVHPLRYGWLLKLDEHGCLVPGCHLPNSTAPEPGIPPRLALFPNPARDFINFELRGARPDPDGAFRILDVQGRLLQDIPAREALGTVVVPVHDWAAGAYVVQYLEGGQIRAAERFLKVE
ncbi:MAG: hypothetical protein RIC19_05555 [Phaeodactylibacter sp.]|uniref:hypothetical protein n=1 Tax=Phaeodactylibacter sp. TaxID=1940289 RepID=UPI0032F02B51